mgnify:CR=1 FL=1
MGNTFEMSGVPSITKDIFLLVRKMEEQKPSEPRPDPEPVEKAFEPIVVDQEIEPKLESPQKKGRGDQKAAKTSPRYRHNCSQ